MVEEPPARGIGTWIAANPLTALTLAGLVLYADLRLCAAIFYGRLGTKPEEVGLGYAETVAQSILGVGALVMLLVLMAILSQPGVLFGGGAQAHPTLTALLRHALTQTNWFPRAVALIVVLLVVVLPLLALRSGVLAQRGKPVHLTLLSPFPLSAEVAMVWITSPDYRLPTIDNETCALYLGTSQGVVLLYESGEEFTWRVPSSSIVLSVGGELAEFETVEMCNTAAN